MNPLGSGAFKSPLRHRQSITLNRDGQTGASEHYHSLPALTDIRHKSISRSLGGGLTQSLYRVSQTLERWLIVRLCGFTQSSTVLCRITDAWILMTTLVGALFSSLLVGDVHSHLYRLYCSFQYDALTQTRKCNTQTHTVEFEVAAVLYPDVVRLRKQGIYREWMWMWMCLSEAHGVLQQIKAAWSLRSEKK